jgi:hypothetical protein
MILTLFILNKFMSERGLLERMRVFQPDIMEPRKLPRIHEALLQSVICTIGRPESETTGPVAFITVGGVRRSILVCTWRLFI